MVAYLKQVVEEGDIDLLDQIAAEDMVDETAIEVGWGPGRRGLIRHVRYYRNAMEGLRVDVERIIASDDEVVGIWRARGIDASNLFGVPASRRPLDYRNASVFRIRDGQIVHYTGVWAALDAVRQMGVEIATDG